MISPRPSQCGSPRIGMGVGMGVRVGVGVIVGVGVMVAAAAGDGVTDGVSGVAQAASHKPASMSGIYRRMCITPSPLKAVSLIIGRFGSERPPPFGAFCEYTSAFRLPDLPALITIRCQLSSFVRAHGLRGRESWPSPQ